MRRYKTTILSLLPVLAAVIVYLPSLPGDFIFDDVLLLEKGERLREFDLERILWDNYWGTERLDTNYRPVLLSSFAANFLLGESALPFRLVNLALTALVGWLAFLVLRELLGDEILAALGATLFTVLPIHSESVAWIVGRGELLAAAAVLGAWWLVLKTSASPRLPTILAAGGIVFLGLGAKENTIVALPLFLAGALLAGRPRAWKGPAAAAAIGCVAFVVYVLLRQAVLAEEFAIIAEGRGTLVTRIDNPLHSSFCDAPTRIANAVRLLGHYAALTMVPIRLSADYSLEQVPVLPLSSARLWLEIAAFAIPFGAVLLVFWKRAPVAALGALVFLIGFAASSNILFPIGTIFGERLAFLPSFGFPLLVTGLLAVALRSGVLARPTVAIVLLAIIAAYAARTAYRALEWRDRHTLYLATARDAPRSTRAQNLGAIALQEQAIRTDDPRRRVAILEEAAHYARRALEIYPENARALGRLASITFTRARDAQRRGEAAEGRRLLAEAETHFTRALETLGRGRQSEPRYWLERGQVRFRLGEVQEALADVDRHIETLEERGTPVEAVAFNFRGLYRGVLSTRLRGEGRTDEADRLAALARRDLDEAIRLRKDQPEFFNNRGYLRFLEGDLAGALDDYQTGLRICRRAGALFDEEGESAYRFHLRLADVYARLGDREAAQREIDAAKRLAAETR